MSGYSAYSKAARSYESPRSVEYRLLGQVTGALIAARDNEGDVRKRMDALLWNKQVWDAFLVDLNSDGNQLPTELKQSLIGLALWVNRETSLVMDGEADLDALIDVNQNIMEGLKDGG